MKLSQEQIVRAERMVAIGKLATNLGHEFNNVLAIIGMTSELAMLRRRRGIYQEALKRIASSAKRGGSITRGLLTFTRQFEPRHEHIILEDAIEPLMAMLETRFRQNNITVIKDIAPALPVLGDPGLLAQAVLNIVTNALDAMPKGGTLTLRAWQEEQTIYLELEDTGTGMPESIRDRVFEPFTTYKPLIAHRIGGNGLGLAITFGIVNSHGGTFKIESETGKGTTIIITLPVDDDIPEPTPPVPPRRLEGPQNVMIVDDEQLIAESLAEILRLDGHQVVWFVESEPAIAALEQFAPDVLIADLQIPNINGQELLKIAHERYPEMHQVLITGQAERLEQPLNLEPDIDLIRKPFTTTELYAVIGRYQSVEAVEPEERESTLVEHPEIYNDLRHKLLNQVSSLEGMFRLLQLTRPTEPAAIDRAFTYLGSTICETSIFLRSQHLLDLLNGRGSRSHSSVRFPVIKLFKEAQEWTKAGLLGKQTVSIQIDCSGMLEIQGDSKSLLPALLAAIQNAIESIKRAGEANGTITLSGQRDGDLIILSVEDNGSGIDPDILYDIAHYGDEGSGEQFIGILEPRYGVGLGIPLMIRVARLHQGTVEYGNRTDRRGAWVRWTLPMTIPAAPRPAPALI